MRAFLGFLAGFVAAVFVVSVIEAIGHAIWPPPSDLDPTNAESMRTYLANIPLGALLSVALAWVAGSFAGSWLASTLGRSRTPGRVIGAFILLSSLATLTAYPHPWWFWAVALIGVPAASVLGVRLAGRTPKSGLSQGA